MHECIHWFSAELQVYLGYAALGLCAFLLSFWRCGVRVTMYPPVSLFLLACSSYHCCCWSLRLLERLVVAWRTYGFRHVRCPGDYFSALARASGSAYIHHNKMRLIVSSHSISRVWNEKHDDTNNARTICCSIWVGKNFPTVGIVLWLVCLFCLFPST